MKGSVATMIACAVAGVDCTREAEERAEDAADIAALEATVYSRDVRIAELESSLATERSRADVIVSAWRDGDESALRGLLSALAFARATESRPATPAPTEGLVTGTEQCDPHTRTTIAKPWYARP